MSEHQHSSVSEPLTEGSDVCACGDYRSQHVDSKGKCKVCDPRKHAWDGCVEFRLLRRATPAEQDHWHLYHGSAAPQVPSVSEEVRPTLRGILLWCGAADPDDLFLQKGLARMIDRYSRWVEPSSADWQQAKQATAIFTQRDEFERWWNVRHSNMTWALTKAPDGDYIYLHTELAWQAWQEAKSQ